MDFRMRTSASQTEKRGWLRGPHGAGPGDNPSVVLDISKFTPATHFPNGFIPSGCALGRVTATGMYGPYDNAATDGRETARGLLFSSETVNAGQTKALNAMLIHGMVDPARLPFQSGSGAFDAAAQAEIPNIYTA